MSSAFVIIDYSKGQHRSSELWMVEIPASERLNKAGSVIHVKDIGSDWILHHLLCS